MPPADLADPTDMAVASESGGDIVFFQSSTGAVQYAIFQGGALPSPKTIGSTSVGYGFAAAYNSSASGASGNSGLIGATALMFQDGQNASQATLAEASFDVHF